MASGTGCSRISSCKSSYYQLGTEWIRRFGHLNKRPLAAITKTRCSKKFSALMNITMENLDQMASSQDTLFLNHLFSICDALFNHSQPVSLAMALWDIPDLCVSHRTFLIPSPAHCGLRRKN